MTTFNIFLLILFSISFSEYDFIIFQKRFSIVNEGSKFYKWYFTNNWQTTSWWLKNVLVFLLDGLHLNSSIMRFITFFYAAQLLTNDVFLIWALATLFYAVSGTVHSLLNGTIKIPKWVLNFINKLKHVKV